jgi:hypothetical protein
MKKDSNKPLAWCLNLGLFLCMVGLFQATDSDPSLGLTNIVSGAVLSIVSCACMTVSPKPALH